MNFRWRHERADRFELVDCRRTETVYEPGRDHSFRDDFQCGNFDEGRYAWRRRGSFKFKTPVPFRGAQGFFGVHAPSLPEYSSMMLNGAAA